MEAGQKQKDLRPISYARRIKVVTGIIASRDKSVRSPIGATVNSQGCEPLECSRHQPDQALKGRQCRGPWARYFRPFGAERYDCNMIQGFAPLAIDLCPVGAKTCSSEMIAFRLSKAQFQNAQWRKRQNDTGSDCSPRRWKFSCHTNGPSPRRILGKRCNRVSNASRASRRASGAPRQKCGPMLKAT